MLLFVLVAASVDATVIEAFSGLCLRNTPTYVEKLTASANVMGWKPIEGDAAKLLGPADPNVETKLWRAEFEGVRMMIGYTIGELDGRRVETCTLASPDANGDAMQTSLEGLAKLTLVDDTTEIGQRYVAWTVPINDQDVLINLTTMADRSEGGVTLSVSAKLR